MATKALQSLTDDALLLRLAELLRDSRRVEADLVAHIAEVDARGLYLREACSSMFSYCVERLRLSEPETGLRIHVARASRRHPVLLQMLRDGRMHLSGVAVLAPHLTEDNRDRVLARAAHRTKAQLLELIAEIAPRPDVRPSMRKLPTRVADNELGHSPGSMAFSWSAGSAAGIDARAPQFFGHGLDDVGYPGDGGPAALPVEHRLDDVAPPGVAVPTGTGSRALEDDALPGDVGPSAGIRSPVCRPLILARPTDRPARSGHVIEPLAPGRYRVQFTAGAPLRAKLERLQVLMARAVPDGDLAVLIEAAVTERIERLESQRLAATKRPRSSVAQSDTRPGPRHIPAAVKRVVRERDGDRCA